VGGSVHTTAPHKPKEKDRKPTNTPHKPPLALFSPGLGGTGLGWDWARVACDTEFRDTIKGLSNINGETVQC